MGMRIPPFPPPRWLIDQRIKNGATTMREIDPEFADWCDAGNRLLRLQGACLVVGLIGVMAVIVAA